MSAAGLSDSVEARALAVLARRLREHPLNEHDELIARAAYLDGWRDAYVRGGRDCLDSCTALNTALQDRRFRTAIATLLQFVETKNDDPDQQPDWREVKRV